MASRREVVAPQLGNWFVLLRKTFAKLSQEELAQCADVSVGQVRAAERGENVGIVYVQKIIAALRAHADKNKIQRLQKALQHDVFDRMVNDAHDRWAIEQRDMGEGHEPTKRVGRSAKKRA